MATGPCPNCRQPMTVVRGEPIICEHCGTEFEIVRRDGKARLQQVKKTSAPATTIPSSIKLTTTTLALVAGGVVLVVCVLLAATGLIAYNLGRNAAPGEQVAQPAAGGGDAVSTVLSGCDMDAWADVAGDDLVDFLDATDLATSTRRDSVAPLVRDMQAAYRAFDRDPYPACGNEARNAIISGMKYAIDMMNKFSANDDLEFNIYNRLASAYFYDARDALVELTTFFVDERLMSPEMLWDEDLRAYLDDPALGGRAEAAVVVLSADTRRLIDVERAMQTADVPVAQIMRFPLDDGRMMVSVEVYTDKYYYADDGEVIDETVDTNSIGAVVGFWPMFSEGTDMVVLSLVSDPGTAQARVYMDGADIAAWANEEIDVKTFRSRLTIVTDP